MRGYGHYLQDDPRGGRADRGKGVGAIHPKDSVRGPVGQKTGKAEHKADRRVSDRKAGHGYRGGGFYRVGTVQADCRLSSEATDIGG